VTAMTGKSKRLYLFGLYRLDPAERLLTRNGDRVPVTPKAFDLLLALVERHGRLVEKDKLMKLVWPGTFVEESNLSFNVSVLRKALDHAGGSPYIETVPTRGYRFASPVREEESNQATLRRRLAVPVAAALAIAVLATGLWWHDPPGDPVPVIEALTSYTGREIYPALSPDGNHVAFSWNGENEDNFEIYVQPVGTSVPLRLTTNPARDLSPAWSPDGRMIAFIRSSPGAPGRTSTPDGRVGAHGFQSGLESRWKGAILSGRGLWRRTSPVANQAWRAARAAAGARCRNPLDAV